MRISHAINDQTKSKPSQQFKKYIYTRKEASISSVLWTRHNYSSPRYCPGVHVQLPTSTGTNQSFVTNPSVALQLPMFLPSIQQWRAPWILQGKVVTIRGLLDVSGDEG